MFSTLPRNYIPRYRNNSTIKYFGTSVTKDKIDGKGLNSLGQTWIDPFFLFCHIKLNYAIKFTSYYVHARNNLFSLVQIDYK